MIQPSPRPAAATHALERWLLYAVLAAGAVFAIYVLAHGLGNADAAVSSLRLQDIPFNGTRAYGYLKQLCELGPRPSDSDAMQDQQKLLEQHFTKAGGKVSFQRFTARHPVDGSAVPMANILVQWHPDRKDRLMLCGHYDTLPFPLRDPRRPKGRFVGANDNGSGVALLMELAHEMPKLQTKLGVDFVLFDGEEFIFDERHKFFLGSEHFAREYVREPPEWRYRAAVLLDMVGGKDLQLYYERNSYAWADSRGLFEEIWGVAKRLRVREFNPRLGAEISDDHLPLHEIAKIPAIDLIDADYGPANPRGVWHTERDVPEQCSALSLAKVGWVLREWLKTK